MKSPRANSSPAPVEKVKSLFRAHGGTLRTSEAIKAGLHPRTLYALRDAGLLERLSRGIYRFADSPAWPIPIW